jgi:N-acetylneuraminic acid mutarotase
MIVWGGNGTYGNQVGPFKDGVRYNPATAAWTATTTFGAPSPRLGHTAVWTGTEMIIWGGSGVIYLAHLADGGRYDPTTDSWRPLNNIDAPSPRDTHTAIWTGSEMIIWGGSGGSPYYYFNDGARYDPLTDTWTATSPTGAPPERALHSVAWTGSEMIVWGGQGTNGASLRSGGRYDPLSDSWRDTTLANAPANRYQHAAVWTGTEMIIWGGYGLSGASDTGARYNPASDNWTMVSLAGAPPPRYRPTAVWTGMEMIVWGDREGGGRYDPAADAWSPVTSIGEPLATRSGHSAVWTGREMLICGGADTSGAAITSTYGYVAPRKLYVYLLP